MNKYPSSHRHLFPLVSVLIIMALMLASCAPAPTAAPAPTQPPAVEQPTQAPPPTEAPQAPAATDTAVPEPPASTEPVTITWLNHWSDPDTAAYWTKVADQFMVENPNIKINIINSGFDDLLTTYMTQYNAGNAPDVFHIKYDLLPDLVAAGAIMTPPDAALQDIKQNWAPAAVGGMTYQDKVWGYPTEIGLRAMMYNTKLLKEAGVAEPPYPKGWTFDEYRAAAKQISEKTSAKGAGFIIQYEASTTENFVNFLWNNGGEFINADNTHVLFNSPEGVQVLQLWKDMIADKSVSLFNTDDTATALGTETIATYDDANWWKLMFFDTYDQTNGKGAAQQTIKVTGTPYTKKNTSRSYVFGLVVSSQSKHPAEAWKWSQYIAAPRGPDKNSYMADFLTTFWGIIPSNLQDQKLSPVLVNEPYTAAYVGLMETAIVQPVFKGYIEIQHILAGEIENVYQNGKDPKAALDDAATAADAVLAKNK
jgi:multiple sugar transport system substrate-binding protein